MRISEINRKTGETDIQIKLNLDGEGKFEGNTGVGFLDHMMNLFARHARFDLTVYCKGDVEVDFHHSVEDIGIALGQAVRQALGDKRGIKRYGQTILPMDEALILSALDVSGRGECYYALNIPTQRVGNFDTELTEEFWIAFARNAKLTLHIRQLAGSNSHHIIEGSFKSVARSLRTAVSCDIEAKDEIPSTKGLIE
ncbi:MAG: imidazoleglycerol-phosphate dehydratase HisB [Clostridia bacterium]|nr:imidazoleglycerol-phosphate dehydratase HisB [Clostridia bacterium]